MTILSSNRTLLNAKSFSKIRQKDQTIKAYKTFLNKNPDNLSLRNFSTTLFEDHLPNEVIEELKKFYNQGEFKKIVYACNRYFKEYQGSYLLWNFFGVANLALGNDFQALESFKKAVNINPNFLDGLNNMGVTLEKLGDLDKASKVYCDIIAINPNYSQAYNNLGNVLRKKGDLTKALEMFYKALSLEPDYADANSNLGIILQEKGRVSEAIKAFKKVLSIKPNCIATLNSLGNAFKDQKKLLDAIYFFNRALIVEPNFELARAQKFFMLSLICDWEAINKDSYYFKNIGIHHKFVPTFSLLSLEDCPKKHRKRAETFANLVFLYKSIPLETLTLKSNKRIRIGYFSADFHDHATMHLMSKVFNLHDRTKFEIYAYSIGPKQDDYMRQHLIESVDIFDDVSHMSDRDIALLARQDEIDIAIDLKGYTHKSRTGIFAFGAAPIQINYLGYPGTMGANFIDYIIADKIIIPKEYRNYYSEKIIYMPYSYQPNNNNRLISEKEITKSDMGLPEDSFVFCSFNNSYKITPREFDIWMRILKNIEGSVLWLLKSNQWAEDNLKKEAENRGINSNRIIFANKIPHEEHLARHKLADLFLDTFNVNAHTTASDALWAGLPVVTKLGKGFAARVAGSLLNAIGLSELITDNEKDYEELILNLALNKNKLLRIKEKLLVNRQSYPLFDSEKYIKHLESGYQQAYKNYIDGFAPKNININKSL